MFIFQDIVKLDGYHLLKIYSFSLSDLLSSVYPEYEWLPWKFYRLPRNYWVEVKNQHKFVEWAGKELKIEQLSDWFNVNYKVKIKSFLLCNFIETC